MRTRRDVVQALVAGGVAVWAGCERAVARATEAAESGPPGVVIAHEPAAKRQYVGSPSIDRLPSGEFVASHDLFGPGSSRDTTRVFASSDGGATWTRRAEIRGQWWSSLFVHRDALYLMGVSREYGSCVIRRSGDGGRTWSEPRDRTSGLLFDDGPYHCAPVPVVVHGGRIWRAMEDAQAPGGWGVRFRAFVMSAPEEADLLDASQWTATNRLASQREWAGGEFGGFLEGNVVVTPDGKIVNLLRADVRQFDERAARLSVSADGTTVTFDPERDIVSFPGGCKKFTIRRDERSGAYYTLANHVPREHRRAENRPDRTRNTLSLWRSEDLKRWTEVRTLLSHPDAERHGFQYADWRFDGEDLVAVVRTAFVEADGTLAHNAHDANFMTFHRWSGFRTWST